MPRHPVPLAAAGALLLGLAVSPPLRAEASDPPVAAPLHAVLAGAGGSGSFEARFNDTLDQLCYVLKVDGVAQARAARIHLGAAGENGAPVVTLQTPAQGTAQACATVTAELAIRLNQHPERFYVAVTSTAGPNGAVRGQLER